MTLLQAIILGIIQGLTEFLPVSSSAHLVLTPFLLGWNIPAEQVFPFDVLVQMGTLVAVIIYFWKDLITILRGFFEGLVQKQPFGSEPARLGWYLILGSIPAGVAGLFLKDMVEQAFSSPGATALLLLGTAALLITAEMLGRRTRSASDFNWLDALVMGLFQAVSIFPGISRSGSTISGGLFRQLDRVTAARFSFLLSIPVMLAAGGLGVLDLLEVANWLPSCSYDHWFCDGGYHRLSFHPLAVEISNQALADLVCRVLHIAVCYQHGRLLCLNFISGLE